MNKSLKREKDTVKSFYKWVDLPEYINKESKCEFCKKENTLQYTNSLNLTSIATKGFNTFYRCKSCKILKL